MGVFKPQWKRRSVIFTEHFVLKYKHCSRWSTLVIFLNSHNCPLKQVPLLAPFLHTAIREQNSTVGKILILSYHCHYCLFNSVAQMRKLSYKEAKYFSFKGLHWLLGPPVNSLTDYFSRINAKNVLPFMTLRKWQLLAKFH